MNISDALPPQESSTERLQREYSWAIHDGDITTNGVLYRWLSAGEGEVGLLLFREPQHTEEDMRQAESELRDYRDIKRLYVTPIEPPEKSWSGPTPGCWTGFG